MFVGEEINFLEFLFKSGTSVKAELNQIQIFCAGGAMLCLKKAVKIFRTFNFNKLTTVEGRSIIAEVKGGSK